MAGRMAGHPGGHVGSGEYHRGCVAMPHRRVPGRHGVLVVAPHAKLCGAFCFTVSHAKARVGMVPPRTEVTLEVTSALNLVSTTVSGYLKSAS